MVERLIHQISIKAKQKSLKRATCKTSNNIKTSITLMGTTLFRKARGHRSENRILLSVQLYTPIITQVWVFDTSKIKRVLLSPDFYSFIIKTPYIA
ncbi:hypothetical protein D3Z55_21030 [Clostridiaceae bacterium]|nr:hypothetical protein [Clostridiaceae bacterium]